MLDRSTSTPPRPARLAALAAAAALTPLAAQPADASTIFFTGGGTDWVDPVNWGGNAVVAGEVYSTNPATSFETLSVGTDFSFDGDLLILDGFNNILFTGNAAAFSVDIELANGGTIQRNATGTTVVDGTITVDTGNGQLFATGGGARFLDVDSLITGAGTLIVGGGAADDGVIVNNAANTFSGLWDLAVNAADDGVFRSTAQGSLGTGDVLIEDGAFEATYDLVSDDNVVNFDGGAYALGVYDHTFLPGEFIIGGTALPEGVYTVSELNSFLAGLSLDAPNSGVFEFTGTTGTITIVPEPASAVLAGGGLLLIARRRRR